MDTKMCTICYFEKDTNTFYKKYSEYSESQDVIAQEG